MMQMRLIIEVIMFENSVKWLYWAWKIHAKPHSTMMTTMLGCPPDRTTLQRERAERAEQDLYQRITREGGVCRVAVKADGHADADLEQHECKANQRGKKRPRAHEANGRNSG